MLQAGRRYNREWIFRNATRSFSSGTAYAITGANGSGKSTLLQCLAGILRLSEGKTRYTDNEKELPEESVYRSVSFCAPYLELIEEMTLTEFLDFHGSFKPYINGYGSMDIIRIIGLEGASVKQIRYYSSGMKQRVKLAQALLSQTAAIFLDEPCTNLDTAGIDLYHSLISQFCKNRLVMVSSNDPVEYRFCTEKISMQELK